MKVLFAALFLLSSATLFAQNRHGRWEGNNSQRIESQRHDHGHGHYVMTARERDFLIQRIRKEYSWKIQNVKESRYMRSGQKRREIRHLQHEMDHKIREVNTRYNAGRNSYPDRYRNRW